MNIPVDFPGTTEEAEANRQTHYFDGEDMRCIACDCRSWGAYASYPCGADVPREDVTEVQADAALNLFHAHLAVDAMLKEFV